LKDKTLTIYSYHSFNKVHKTNTITNTITATVYKLKLLQLRLLFINYNYCNYGCY